MKQYGASFATEFTKKQINVVFAKAKNGELKIEKWYLQNLYNLAEYYGYDDSRSVAAEEQAIKTMLEKMFNGEIEDAQKIIDFETESLWKRLSIKRQKASDRSLVK